MSKDLDRARAAATLADAAVSLGKSSAVFEAESINSDTALKRAARRLLRRISPEDDTEATSCEVVELDASELDLAKTAKVLIDAADKVWEMEAAAPEELDFALNRVLAQIRWFAWDESTEDEIKEERSKSIQELLEEHDQICRPSRKQRVRSRRRLPRFFHRGGPGGVPRLRSGSGVSRIYLSSSHSRAKGLAFSRQFDNVWASP